jgi:hypothetical protein
MDKRINQNDSQIKSIGKLIDFASSEDVEKYFGSKIVSEKTTEDIKVNQQDSLNTDETETNYII